MRRILLTLVLGMLFLFGGAVAAAAPADLTTEKQPLTVEPTPWSWLWVFPATLVGSLLIAAVWLVVRRMRKAPWELKYLDEAWSFKDSWAGNVTVIGSLLTGVFGSSSVVKTLLGKDANNEIALATVGAAVAVVFIAAGPIVLLSTKSEKQNLTTIGLFAAAAFTVTGALGELILVTRTGLKLELGGMEWGALVAGVLGGLLLLWYSFTTLRQTVKDGTTPPEAAEESDIIKAARLVVAAITGQPQAGLEAATPTGGAALVPAPIRRRTASL